MQRQITNWHFECEKLFEQCQDYIRCLYLETLTIVIALIPEAKPMIRTAMSLTIWCTPWICASRYILVVVKRLDHSLRWAPREEGGVISHAAGAAHSSGECSACHQAFHTMQFWPCCTAHCRTPASVICIHRSLTLLHSVVIQYFGFILKSRPTNSTFRIVRIQRNDQSG